jgi:hypothetical protein
MAKQQQPTFKIGSTHDRPLADELMGAPPPAPAATPTPQADVAAMPAQPPSLTERRSRQPAGRASEAPERVPIRVQVPAELADRVRGAVAALAYRVEDWTSLNAATAAALEQFVTEAEQAYNGGQPFPWQAGRPLSPGRRVGQ